MNFTAIIPARYASTRFPGKPLALLGNKPVIQHVYEQTSSVLSEVWVATDDKSRKIVGWYENADLSGTAQTSIQTDSLKDIDLYAKWTYQQTISVTIESGSWSSESTSSSFKLTYNNEDLSDGETITSSTGEITLTVPDLYGYTYTWKVDGSTTDASGTAYSSDNTLTINTTGWKKGIYDISVIATNGTEYQSCFAQIKVGY